MEMIKSTPIPTINSTTNSVISKVVEDVISDNFFLKKFPSTPKKQKGSVKKTKILALWTKLTKICIYIIWGPLED